MWKRALESLMMKKGPQPEFFRLGGRSTRSWEAMAAWFDSARESEFEKMSEFENWTENNLLILPTLLDSPKLQ